MSADATGPSPARSGGVARVVLDTPLPQLDREFEYAVPESLRDGMQAGVRVRVPLRAAGRLVGGYVRAVTGHAEYPGRLATVRTLVSPARVVTEGQFRLARAIADRQAGCAADVLRLAVPTRSARLETRWLAGGEGREARRSAPIRVDGATMVETARYGEAAVRLGGDGERLLVEPPVGCSGDVPRALLLLAECAAGQLRRGRSSIVAVPDYRDVVLLRRALERIVPAARIRDLHARQTDRDRYREYLACLEDEPSVIIGNRSALYAPAHALGAILLWDDGDSSFEEPLAPYASSRDVALVRSGLEGCSLIMAAHSPSLAALRLRDLGYLDALAPERAAPPRIVLTAAAVDGGPYARRARIPELAWRIARDGLERGPVLVQVARAGYAPRLVCARCGAPARCETCGGPLVRDRPASPPHCGVCGRIAPRWRCGECGGEGLGIATKGVRRTAEELGRAFPGVRVRVADGEHEVVEVAAAPQLVVATRGAEPFAPGGYAAVVLLDAERLLVRESLDAVVDAMRFWSNAAALVADDGRVALTGEEADPIRAVHAWSQARVAARELAERRELRFPPAVRVGVLRGSADELAAALGRLRSEVGDAVEVLGPVPDAPVPQPGEPHPETFDGPDAAPPLERAVLRFGYRDGPAVAAAVKAALVVAATRSRPARRAGRGAPGDAQASTLRAHLDEPGIF